MTGHLIESTILLGMAIAAAHLPRLAARTRYAIVFLALLKFAVPWKFHAPSATIAIAIPAGPVRVAPHAFAAPSIWPVVLEAIWLAVAAALFLLVVARARRAAAEALEGASVVPELGRRGVRVLRSPGATAPAAIGIVRPCIVLPAALDLDDGELAAILTHECAHIDRRDNLLALVEALLGAALWFHPLVWMARRILARAREEACDEVVVARGQTDTDTYLAALAKVCRAAAAPRVAGVSCIVSNTIRERMNAIMNLPLRRALPHRLVVAVAVALLAAVTLVHAKEGKSRYTMSSTINVGNDNVYDFDITVRDNTTGEVVCHPHVKTKPGASAEATCEGVPKFNIQVTVENNGHAEVLLKVFDADGKVIDGLRTVITVNKQPGPKITLNLQNADLKDVIGSFGKLSGMDVQIDPGVEGTVTVDLRDVPWDQALQRILADNKCEYETDGKTIHVRRIR